MHSLLLRVRDCTTIAVITISLSQSQWNYWNNSFICDNIQFKRSNSGIGLPSAIQRNTHLPHIITSPSTPWSIATAWQHEKPHMRASIATDDTPPHRRWKFVQCDINDNQYNSILITLLACDMPQIRVHCRTTHAWDRRHNRVSTSAGHTCIYMWICKCL